MKRILTIIISALALTSTAQTGMLMNRYYITGSLALGKEERSFADTSCWLQIGKDTTKKGFILPRVLLDSIRTAKRGLYVYDLKDSVLYHFDGNKKVRYMTYKDTVLIKQLITTGVDTNIIATKYYVNNNGFIKDGGNAKGGTITIGTNDNQVLNIKTNNTNRVVIASDGAVGIGVTPSVGELHVNGAVGANGIKYINNTTSGGLPGTFKDAAYGIVDIGAAGSSTDYMLVNNPTQGLTVFEVPHNTKTTHFYGQVEVKNNSTEVQTDLSGTPSGHLFSGVSTGTFDASNRGFISFGDSYTSTNSALVFGNTKLSVANANLLIGSYTDNGTDKLQINGTAISQGLKLNNTTGFGNPANYNIVRRYNDGIRDGVEILCGGAVGGYAGGFKIKSFGINATTTPVESFMINKSVISMGHHGVDATGNSYFCSNEAQVNIARDNIDGYLLNLWNRRNGYPVIMSLGNDAWGAGGPMTNSAIVSEVAPDGYKGHWSVFTNAGATGDFSSNKRALFIDGSQNIGIGVSRNVGTTYFGAGLTLPSARLHVLGNIAATPVSIFQSASSQVADIMQWQDNSGNILAKVDKDGNTTVQKLKTAQPSSNGAGEIKIGKIITGASVTLQTDKFLEVDVDGTVYKLAIVQ